MGAEAEEEAQQAEPAEPEEEVKEAQRLKEAEEAEEEEVGEGEAQRMEEVEAYDGVQEEVEPEEEEAEGGEHSDTIANEAYARSAPRVKMRWGGELAGFLEVEIDGRWCPVSADPLYDLEQTLWHELSEQEQEKVEWGGDRGAWVTVPRTQEEGMEVIRQKAMNASLAAGG